MFVAFEGPSGTGKSTVAGLVAADLPDECRVLLTREPSDGPLGAHARDGTHRHRGPALACLVAADRYTHLEQTILPALAEGRVVLCDRYVLSSLVLQRLDGVDPEFVAAVNALAPPPDLYVVLTATPATAVRRVAGRGQASRFHPRTRNDAVREADAYAEETARLEAHGRHVVRVPTDDRPADEVARAVSAAVSARIIPPTPAGAS